MQKFKLTIVHQWWLEHEELCTLFFGGNRQCIDTRVFPRFTDCSESIYWVDALTEAPFSHHFKAAFALDDIRTAVELRHLFAAPGAGLDERVISFEIVPFRYSERQGYTPLLPTKPLE